MHYKNTLKSFRFPKPTQPRHLKLKTNLQQTTKGQPLLVATCTISLRQPSPTRPGECCIPRLRLRPIAIATKLELASVSKTKCTSIIPPTYDNMSPGRGGRALGLIDWSCPEPRQKRPERGRSQLTTTSKGFHYTKLPIANFHRLMTRELTRERTQII